MVCEATGWTYWPDTIRQLPLSTYLDFWAYHDLQNDDAGGNPAVGRPIYDLISFIGRLFSGE